MFGFCEAEVNRLHDTLVSPRSESEDTEGECVKLADDDNDILHSERGLRGNGRRDGVWTLKIKLSKTQTE